MTGTIVMYCSAAVKSGVSDCGLLCVYGRLRYGFGCVYVPCRHGAYRCPGIKPILEMVKARFSTPCLKLPRVSRVIAERLSGGIELNNVSFRYSDSMPSVIVDNMSIKIRPGQYVAIVGSTGCGKSTLMRLMLGFEKAQKGAIYYDGRDISKLDLKSLRRRIGVVMQDSKLFSGDIYSNITISAPWLTLA